MSIQGLTDKICRGLDCIKIHFYTNFMLKELMKKTPYMEIRVKIWKKLGNQIGKDAYINNNIILIDNSDLVPNIILGERVALAPYVTFITDSGPNKSRLAIQNGTSHYLKRGTITIGDDTWIGTNTVIHPGINIGKNSIIGACSNVTHDIPDNVVAYGNPAKVIHSIILDNSEKSIKG